jgi:hypothetical protein
MTKLQNLYRAAIAADASVAVPGVSIDAQHGGWFLLDKENNTHSTLSDFVMFIELFNRLKIGRTIDGIVIKGEAVQQAVYAELERIARKETK